MNRRGQAYDIAIILLVLCLILVIIVLVFLNTPLFNFKTISSNTVTPVKKTCTTLTIPYTTTEQYTEKVPYYDYDYYRDFKRYSDSGEYEYMDSTFNKLSVKGKVRIYNKDDKSRFFKVKMYYTPRNGNTVIKEDYGYVKGDSSRTFTTYYYNTEYNDNSYVDFDYRIIPEDRDYKLLRYRDEIKTKTITKFRTEEVCN